MRVLDEFTGDADSAGTHMPLIGGLGGRGVLSGGGGLAVLHPDYEARERAALRIIALSFFALAAYVSVEPVRALLGYAEPRPSIVGIVLAPVSLVVMPWLSWAQRRTGRELESRSAVADSKQTLLCTYLSAVLLVGLGLNSLFGWSWADPIRRPDHRRRRRPRRT